MNDIIFYKGRYWLAEKYDDNLYGGGWFASPIYETETGLEVRPAGGDWCYKSNGAIISEILPNEKLTQTAKSELKFIIESLVEKREEKFVNFFNYSGPISLRAHTLELLPGIGKRHAKELLEEREVRPFVSFEDIKTRVSSVSNPKKLVIQRIMDELEEKDRFKLFVRV